MSKRTLKILGLALVAAITASAIAAGAASADEFHAGEAPVTYEVVENQPQALEYEEGGEKVVCETLRGTGLADAESPTEVRFFPIYEDCELAELGGNAAVDFNGCSYLLSLEEDAPAGPVHVRCPSGQKISIAATVPVLGDICTIHIGEQTPTGDAVYADGIFEGKSDVTVTPGQTGIEGSITGGNYSGLCGEPTSSTGGYTGSATLIGRTGDEFHAEEAPVTYEVVENQPQYFEYENGSGQLLCDTLRGSATSSSHATSEVRFFPVYEDCGVASIGWGIEVQFNGCSYRLALEEDTAAGPVYLECPSEQTVTMKVTDPSLGNICTIQIGPQTLGSYSYSNGTFAGKGDIYITPEVTGIDGSITGGSFSGLCGKSTSNTGSWSSSTVTVIGRNASGERIGIGVERAQIGISVG